MKILYFVRNFSLPQQPGSLRSWAIVNAFEKLGCDVLVITANTHYMSDSFSRVQQRLFVKETYNNFTVIRIRLPLGFRRGRGLKRLTDYLSFSFLAFITNFFTGDADIVIASTPPPFVLFSAYLVAKFKKAHFIIEEKDVYPDVAAALGYIKKEGVVYKTMKYWNQFFRSRASHIIVATPGIKKILLKNKVSEKRISVVHNAYGTINIEVECASKLSETTRLLLEMLDKFKDKFVVLYAGGMGYANEIMTILEAAKIIKGKNEKEVVFVFLGEGEKKKIYMEFCKTNKLDNCYFFSSIPQAQMPLVFRKVTVSVHTLKNNPFLSCVLANKIFDSLRNGCPVVFAGRGDTEKLLEDSRGGVSVEPQNPHLLAEVLLHLSKNRDKCKKMGEYGKRYVEQNYSQKKIYDVLLDVLRNTSSCEHRCV